MDESALAPHAADLEKLLAGRYAIVRRIGAGGMGEVYLATDLRHDRQVAIKIIGPQWAGTTGAQRFLREISIVAKLSHPNIVPLYDSGQIGSLLYYVMPYIDGPSLRSRLDSQLQLPVDEALRITFDVADALQYAHSGGIVHRDIKPDNILLQSGRALVTDFGVAKALQAAVVDPVTGGTVAVGTLAYMSPEQASGSTRMDARSDLYSLALVLYEMLAGDLPFRAATPDGMFARKAIGRYAPLRDVRGTVPEHVDEALARALQPVPADRFASVTTFASALRDPHASSAKRRGRQKSWALLSIAAVIVAGGATALWTKRSPPPSALIGLGRIVVSPLENRTGSPSFDHVGLMAGDWITEGLQKTRLVEVVPTPTAVQASRYVAGSAQEKTRDPTRALAAETGAGTVVSGAFYRQGDKLLFRVNIADRRGSRVLQTLTNIVAPVSDPVRGVEELRNRVMGWLAIQYDDRLNDSHPGGDQPPTYEAYRAFSEGMTRYIAVDNANAFPLFLRAFKLDSSFTVALLYASISLTNLGAWPRADTLLQVVNDRREALTGYNQAWLDYRMAFVHGNHEAALTHIREAAREAPGSKAAYNHAVEAFLGGHLREALRAIQALPPDRGPMRGFSPYWDIYTAIQHALGLYDQEYDTGLASRRQYPDRLIRVIPLARALVAKGQFNRLDTLVREADGIPTDPVGWDYGHLLSEVAKEAGAHGRPDVARVYFEGLRNWLAATNRGPTTGWRLVETLYALGRWKDASAKLSSLRRLDPANVQYLGMTGLLHSRTGQRRLAEFVADSLARRRGPYEFGAASLYRARIAATLGDPYVAVARLREALAEGRSYDLELHREIDFKPLLGYPPFEQVKRGKD